MDIQNRDLDLIELARRLRMARAALHMSQIEAATAADISQSALPLYEKGRRQPLATSIKRLAIVYGTSTDWLFGMTDEGEPR